MRSMRPPCHSSNTLDISWSSWHRDMIDTWCILQFGWFCWSPGNQPDVFARQDIYLDIVGFQPHQAQERAGKLLSWVSTPMYRFLIPVFDHQTMLFSLCLKPIRTENPLRLWVRRTSGLAKKLMHRSGQRGVDTNASLGWAHWPFLTGFLYIHNRLKNKQNRWMNICLLRRSLLLEEVIQWFTATTYETSKWWYLIPLHTRWLLRNILTNPLQELLFLLGSYLCPLDIHWKPTIHFTTRVLNRHPTRSCT